MTAEHAPGENARPARDRVLHAIELAVHGRGREAEAEADLAVALSPSAPWTHLARSAVLREAGQNGESLRAADEAVRLAPGDPRAHHLRAAALAGLRRVIEARAAAERAAQLAPGDPAVLRHLGDLAIDRDPAEAERHYRGGLRRDPRSAAAHAGLARALRRLGRSDEAEVEYARAAAVDPAIGELRRRASALLSAILQAAVGTLLAVLVLGWVPDLMAAHRPDAAGSVTVLATLGAVLGPLALLGWTAARIRRLGHEAPISPDLREDLRDLADVIASDAGLPGLR
jgi:Flp pilus assembly protein TadD